MDREVLKAGNLKGLAYAYSYSTEILEEVKEGNIILEEAIKLLKNLSDHYKIEVEKMGY